MTALRTSLSALFLGLLTATSALAGPPLSADDAGIVDVGKIEIELNGAYTRDKETRFGVLTKCSRADAELKATTGLFRNLGFSLAIPYNLDEKIKENNELTSNADGFGDMSVEIKYAFDGIAGLNFAVKPAVIMPTGDYREGLSEGRWQYGTTLIVTKEFAEGKYALHANLGYEHHSYRNAAARASNRSDLWSGTLAGEAEVAKGLIAVAEAGLATTADKSTSENSACATVGARYELTDFIDINAGIKLGLTKPEDDVSILYGVTLKF